MSSQAVQCFSGMFIVHTIIKTAQEIPMLYLGISNSDKEDDSG